MFHYHLASCLHNVPDRKPEVTWTVTKRLIIKFKLFQGSNRADLLNKLSSDKVASIFLKRFHYLTLDCDFFWQPEVKSKSKCFSYPNSNQLIWNAENMTDLPPLHCSLPSERNWTSQTFRPHGKKQQKKKKTLLKALIFIPQAFLPALKAQCIFSPNYFYLCIVLNTF